MHSDWDDAPQRIKKRNGNRRSVGVPLAVVVSGGFLLMFGQDHLATGKQIPTAWETERAAPAPMTPPPVIAPSATIRNASSARRSPEELFWEQVERDRQRADIPQTDFNDANYAPKQLVNVIPGINEVQRVAPQAGRKPAELNGTGHATVSWNDARGRRSSWQTTFSYRNSVIDHTTFCLNVGKGSIPYRACRKGTREWLKLQCRSPQQINKRWRDMYCHAHSVFRT